jgi:hypothetical protein
MDTAFDESYVHACESLARGRQTPEARKLILEYADKAWRFNERYAKALYEMRANEHQFTDDDMVVMHELLVFSTIEMMRAFHLKKTAPVDRGGYTNRARELDLIHLQTMNAESFQKALSNFGVDGARNNRTYSACGLSISLGEAMTEGESPQSAFGGLSREQLSWHGGKIKKGKCVNCHKDTDVGVANWCKKCIKC